MSEKKVIKINPALFTVGKMVKNKTEKKRAHIAPLIQPNSLKNELLRRIKKHKNNEIEKIQDQDKKNRKGITNNETNIGNYTDEFNESMEYLNVLSSEKKLTKGQGGGTTFENDYHMSQNQDHFVPVEMDLPEDLKERAISPSHFVPTNIETWQKSPPIALKYKVDNDVPYGCLKNGYKPTFRTIRNHSLPQQSVRIASEPIIFTTPAVPPPLVPQNNFSERQKRMNVLKETIQKRKSKIPSPPPPVPSPPSISLPHQDIKMSGGHLPPVVSIKETNEEPVTRNMIKKTIRRKFRVGKSLKTNTIGVLIKDRDTRKKIINAQKELKKKNINDVKTYLRKHGLLKVGSTAPNDVVRKMYETSMMTGDIQNNNKDVLLHNFMKEGHE